LLHIFSNLILNKVKTNSITNTRINSNMAIINKNFRIFGQDLTFYKIFVILLLSSISILF